jgi:RND family efflux transporter MFP subunit
MRRLAFAAAALLLAAPAAAQPPAPTVTVANPLSRTVTEWDEFTGRFEAVARVDVRARVSGFIEKIHFRDGQLVAEGDVLFTIDQRPYLIARDAAEAEASRAQAQLDLANSDVARALPLVQSRSIPQRELDAREAQARVAQASLMAARASQATARLNLEWTEVRAPLSGRISDRRVDVGNLVSGATEGGTLLTTIVKVDPIYLEFDASESDYIKYTRLARAGGRPSGRETPHPVEARLADQADWPLLGQLDFVDNVLNPRAGTIRARAVLDNADGFLTPGMFARLRLWAGQNRALMVPDSAIVTDQARRILLVVGADDVVQPRAVTLGPIIDGLRVVRGGVEPTDRVIINGLANPFVRPGAKVRPTPGEIATQQAAQR